MASKMESKTVCERTSEVDNVEVGEISRELQYAGEQASAPAQQLHRNFTARHIQMIGLAGSIGSGLFIGTGKVSPTSIK